MDPLVVNGLPLPSSLAALIRERRWKHPGDARMLELIPFLVAPVDFLETVEAIAFESSGRIADDANSSLLFRAKRGGRATSSIELPWLDVDRAIFIAVDREIGADVGIALDYRTDAADPRVVANEWRGVDGCFWREVAPRFTEFRLRLGDAFPSR